MNIQLSIALDANPRTRPILDSAVKPDGIELIPTPLHPSEMFWRQLKFGDFDVSEMSFSSLIRIIAAGNDDWVGLPIFTTRSFFHTAILVRRDAGIDTPEDMRGKRVGVPEYQQTAALWARGVLKHEFGVDQTEMTFWMERTPEHSHGGATGFAPPPGVTINQIPPDSSIGDMMLSGELDATLRYIRNANLVDRSKADLENHSNIEPLFRDRAAEGRRYYAKTGMYPINHGMVIRRGIAEKHPWAILNLMKAFTRANDIANAQRMEHVEYHRAAGLISAEAYEALREPLVRHGVRANRRTLETAAQYSLEQGLTPRLIGLEEVFAASTMDE